MGTHDVTAGQGGMFGLIFDNTFSKQTSKTATLVILSYPTGAPPQGAHYLLTCRQLRRPLPVGQAWENLALGLGAMAADSAESLHSHPAGESGTANC